MLLTERLRVMLTCLEYYMYSTNFSIIRDFFGYRSPPPRSLSLLNYIKLLKGKHVHINVIRVGIDDPLDPVGSLARRNNISTAIQVARDIFSTVQLGIARILYYDIPVDRTNGHEVINDAAEAKALTSEWSVDNNGIDVFFVRDYIGVTIGRSAVDGPCNKSDACRMTGAVISLEDPALTGQTLAHELGHYLGVDHQLNWTTYYTCLWEDWRPQADCYNDQAPEFGTNLMFPVTAGGTNVDLTFEQGNKMKSKDCYIRGGC